MLYDMVFCSLASCCNDTECINIAEDGQETHHSNPITGIGGINERKVTIMMEDKVDFTNSAKRLPIVFCLDISPSMLNGKPARITLLNTAVKNFISELKSHAKASVSAEISFVTFSTEVDTPTPFECVGSLSVREFSAVHHGGTNMGAALLTSIEIIQQHRENLMDAEIPYYAPFLVLVTDGNPDDNDDSQNFKRAKEEIIKHCTSHVGAEEIIVPFIIGVGKGVNAKTLDELSRGFIDGFFHIKDNSQYTEMQFNNVFKMISNSVVKSIDLNSSHEQNISRIKHDMKDLLKSLSGS